MKQISVLIKPVSVTCNLKCSYCFYKDEAKSRICENKGMMNYTTVEAIIYKVLSANPTSASFFFQGGEPTLIGLEYYEYFIEKVKQFNANNIPIAYAIQTNATKIDEAWAAFLKTNNFLVGISLDGTKEIHNKLRQTNDLGNYNDIIKVTRLLNKYQISYNILIVVTKYVAKHYQKVYNNLKKEGFKYLQFIPCLDNLDNSIKDYSLLPKDYTQFLLGIYHLWLNDLGNDDYVSIRLFDNIYNRLNGKKVELCSYNGKCSCQFVIEANGDVYPCDFYCLDEYLLGNINDNSLDEIYQSSNLTKFLQDGEHIFKKCSNCEVYQLSKGGCRREQRGDALYYCESYHALYEEILNTK